MRSRASVRLLSCHLWMVLAESVYHLSHLTVQALKTCCLRTYDLNFLPQLCARGGSFCREVRQDNLTGKPKTTLPHLVSHVSLAVLHSHCFLVYFFLAVRVSEQGEADGEF